MHPEIHEIQTADDVEALLAESSTRPVLIMKHSYSCGTSAQALDELLDHVDARDAGDVRFAVVTVQTHRDASNAISATLGVRHETPQILLIRHRQLLWHASHFRVTADAIASALSKHATPAA